MQISPESPGVTSGETSSESSSSPQTPLDAGAYFVHAAMNQPLAQDSIYSQNYSLHTDPSCLDHLGQTTGLSYTNGGISDSSRRDNVLSNQSSVQNRPLGHRSTTNDPAFHAPPEQSSGSISTSPSSNNSSAAYSFTGGQRTTFQSPLSLPGLQQPFSNAQSLPANSTSTFAYPGMPARTAEHPSSYLPSQPLPSQRYGYSSSNPVSPNSGMSTVRERYQANLPGAGKYFQAASTTGAQNDRYPAASYLYTSGLPDNSRLLPSSLTMPSTSSSYSAQSVSGGETPPFGSQENFYEIYGGTQGSNQRISPNVDAKIEKGFFVSSDSCWTCYRRNYFAVQCSYQLTPHLQNEPHYLVKDGKQHQIQAMAMSLSARVDGTGGKSIELVQHTPKRDKGPQSQITITRLCPTPPGGKLGHLPHAETHGYSMMGYGGAINGHISPPYFPLQSIPDPNAQQHDPSNPHGSAVTTPTAHQHTFERIQFKSATANNGKRRAQQQYYHLVVELHADIRDANSGVPKWVKVAERVSSQVVVRGRSPSHYSNEGPNSASNHRGSGASGGGGGYNPMSGYGYGGMTTSGASSIGRTFNGGYSMNGYRGNNLAMDPSGMNSHSVNSTPSVVDANGYMDHAGSMIMTTQAAPDFMQPTPIAYNGNSLPPLFGLPKNEDKYYMGSSRIPQMEVGAHTAVY